jgi:hypothetical protein
MPGCGGLSAGVRPRTATPDGSGGTVRGPAAGSVAVRPQRRGVHGGRTSTAPYVRPARTVSPDVSSPTGQPPGRRHHGGRVRRSAAIAYGRCASRVRTPTGHAARVADTCCPQHGSGPVASTGRTTSGMTVEAAAEGPQRFRPGGSNGTGCRTPDRSRAASCLDTPSADTTTWPHTEQDAASSGRSIRRLPITSAPPPTSPSQGAAQL